MGRLTSVLVIQLVQKQEFLGKAVWPYSEVRNSQPNASQCQPNGAVWIAPSMGFVSELVCLSCQELCYTIHGRNVPKTLLGRDREKNINPPPHGENPIVLSTYG